MALEDEELITGSENETSEENFEAQQLVAGLDVTPAEVSFVLPETIVDVIATEDIVVRASIETDSKILAAVASLEATLGKRLDALQSTFNREIRAEATYEKVIDRLHSELQEYKNDLLLNLLRPVFVDLIQLHDDIGKIVGSHLDASEDTFKLVNLMRGFQQGIEDILYRQGVEPFEVEENAFDPRRQRAFSTQVTEDQSQNKTVATRLRKGFRSGEKIIRPEIVSVYALKR